MNRNPRREYSSTAVSSEQDAENRLTPKRPYVSAVLAWNRLQQTKEKHFDSLRLKEPSRLNLQAGSK